MATIPCSVYRSMLRICKKNDPEMINYLKTGLTTFKENSEEFYNFKYINKSCVFFIYGPYKNETANMLSYTKCLLRHQENTSEKMERLFFAHRELPNFFLAKENLNNDEQLLEFKRKQTDQIKDIKNRYKPNNNSNSKPTSFGSAFF